MAGTNAYCASFVSRRRADRRRTGRGLLGAAMLVLAAQPIGVSAFESGRAGFAVRVNELQIPYRIFAVYVLPGEVLEIVPPRMEPDGPGPFSVTASGGGRAEPSADGWRWRAPDAPGSAEILVERAGERIELNAVVLYPSSQVSAQKLNGYRLGDYPAEPLNGSALYLSPDGFVELNHDNADLQLSPHFKLSQFPSKQSTANPRYLVLREQLLLKLELLLERVNDEGYAADTFTVMSGYRTPYYNAAIKNVPYSRHVYGGAADIFIDVAPRDGVMDDLNGDGRLDYRDAQHLYRIADQLFGEPRYAALRGGMGVYGANAAHGAFLHLDARQLRARWGALPETE